MKIACLSTFYPFRGGIAQFNANMYRVLEQQGHELKAFTFSRQYPDFLFPGQTQYVTEADVADPIESIPCLDTINPISYLTTAKKIKEWQPDILLMKYWMSFFGPSQGTVAKLMGPNTKVITVLDNVIPHEKRFIDTPFTSYFMKQNDGFVVMSKQVEKDMLHFQPNAIYNYHPHPLYDHFPAPIDREKACQELGLDPNKKTILFFGFIRNYKGLDLMIDAFNQLDDSYELVIAGESYGDFSAYQSQIDNSPLKANIKTHVRYIDDHEVPIFFSAANVCLLPYKSATQSGISTIALHYELPMIATDVGGLGEYILDGETGFMVEKPEVNLIAEKIKQYFTEDREQDFRENHKKFKENFSWTSLAKSIEDLVGKL
ncbi:glycosyltransferase [Sediminitomix flava]|uniref:Glycosyltransferase involved in cell wall biosynthesis n=1 Tax=Sediminitomix flava TaxID=379075 RepID=A0A315YX51_SEDFL|nr:glycosyltransferase [Sediminitomix flava]PWJ34223.1 glycosyltransferase involved in cell wall biosynthesis [Sediminitomix flava]